MSITNPSRSDVLFGRDSDSWSHDGNKHFRSVVRKYQVEYHSKEKRLDKICIVAKIVEEMTDSGARFLKRDTHNKKCWYEVGRKAVIEKVRKNQQSQ